MLKILAPGQVKELDAHTIQHEPISSIDLMERACRAFVAWYATAFEASEKVAVVCGTGNNGGDGLGIARMLSERGVNVTVWVVRGQDETPDFITNLQRLEGRLEVQDFSAGSGPEIFAGNDVLIDAIFGSGLSRPVEGTNAVAIRCINESGATRIAVDVPSGLFADKPSSGAIVKAHHTVSFQLPKLAFMLPENYVYVGDWHLVDIGLDKSFLRECVTSFYYLTRKSVRKLVKPRARFSHKGNFGHALIIAGSSGKMGACLLAARGALRAGVGLLTVHIPGIGNTILQTTIPEAMVSLDSDDQKISTVPSVDNFDVIGIGPGIGQAGETVSVFRTILSSGKPMVIDADGLNILAANRELLQLVPKGSILTPHPKEFGRLTNGWDNDFDRLKKQVNLAQQLQCGIVLKGAFTSMATADGKVYFNSTGNAGMATGGTGDILAGILTGLMAQGYGTEQAMLLGVYVHGLAGDLAADLKGMQSMTASDLADFLAPAFKAVSKTALPGRI